MLRIEAGVCRYSMSFLKSLRILDKYVCGFLKERSFFGAGSGYVWGWASSGIPKLINIL